MNVARDGPGRVLLREWDSCIHSDDSTDVIVLSEHSHQSMIWQRDNFRGCFAGESEGRLER